MNYLKALFQLKTIIAKAKETEKYEMLYDLETRISKAKEERIQKTEVLYSTVSKEIENYQFLVKDLTQEIRFFKTSFFDMKRKYYSLKKKQAAKIDTIEFESYKEESNLQMA